MKKFTLLFGVFAGTALSTMGAYLCYTNKDGWGWFLFVGFLALQASLDAIRSET